MAERSKRALCGISGLGCSPPVFLSVVLFALSSGRLVEGVAIFGFYASGMGSTLSILSMTFVRAGELMLRGLTKGIERTELASGFLLVVIGFYLIFCFYRVYWVPLES